MRNKILVLAVALFLVLLNSIYIYQSWKMGNVYPFDRISIDNSMKFSISFFDQNIPYNSEILTIDNHEIKDSNIHRYLLNKSVMPAIVYYKINDKLKILTIDKEAYNLNYLAFMLFMIFFANVHIIWGLISRYFNSEEITSSLYQQFSILFGLFIFSLVDSFLFGRFIYFQYIAIFAFIFQIIILAINIFTVKNRTLISKYLFISFLVSIPFSVIFLSYFETSIKMNILFSLLNLASLLLFLSYIWKIFVNFHFLWKTSFYFLVTHFIAIVYPLYYLQKCLLVQVDIPISFIFSFTMLLPMFVGTNIVMESITNNFIFKRNYLFRFFLDVSVGILFSLIFYFVYDKKFYNYRFIVYLITIFLFIVILYQRKVIMSYIAQSMLWGRDTFSESLKKIAGIAASPSDAKKRVESIYSELKSSLNIENVKLYLFEKYISYKIEGLGEFVEYFNDDKFLTRYYKKARGPINRFSLYSGCIFDYSKSDFSYSNNIDFVLPINSGSKVRGFMVIGRRKNNKNYLNSEIKYVQNVSILVFQLIYNEILLMNYILRRKIEQELDIASYVQLRLFPKKVPLNKGLNISFYNRPYVKVSGDFFDFIDLDDDETALVLGDVTGHGLQASMVLSVLSTLIYSLFQEKKSLGYIFKELNNFLTERYSGIELVTLIIVLFNNRTKILNYINAGHPIPIKISNFGKISYIEKKSQILGALSGVEYKAEKIKLNKGDKVFLYTDGIVEIKNEKNNENMGEREILKILMNQDSRGVEEKLEDFTSYIESFDQGFIDDDITIIGFEVE